MESTPALFDLDVPGNRLHPVRPVRPVAPYIGGKRALAGHIVQLIAETPHDAYAECFVGMGGIFFRRQLRPQVETINDWSADVSTFFRVLQRHYQPFLEMIRWQLSTRHDWDRLMRTDPSTLTDLERSARFLFLQRMAFGGKVAGRNMAYTPDMPARFNVNKLQALLEDVHDRLTGVTIERLPWQEFLARYDRPGTLFYLDPPYYGCEDDYGAELFGREQFEPMAEQLAGLKGEFILSINDVPEVRRIFARFRFQEAKLKYTISGGPTDAAELIIFGP